MPAGRSRGGDWRAGVPTVGQDRVSVGGCIVQVAAHHMKHLLAADVQLPASHGAYSPAVIHGSTLYVAGQAAFHPATGELVAGGFREQAHVTLRNLLKVAEAAGAQPADAIRVNVHLADMADFPAFDEVYRSYFSEPYPTRVTVGAQLAPGLLVEIDAVFALPESVACQRQDVGVECLGSSRRD